MGSATVAVSVFITSIVVAGVVAAALVQVEDGAVGADARRPLSTIDIRTVGNLSLFCRRRPCGAGPGTLVLARSLGVSNVVFWWEVV